MLDCYLRYCDMLCLSVRSFIDFRAFVVDSVCLYLRLSICHGQTSNCFFFVSRWKRAIFGRQFSMWHSTVLFSSTFDLCPLTPKIDSPQFAKNAYKSACIWQIDRRCLHLPWGFRGWRIQWNHAKCCGADPCCHGNEIWANFGLFFDKIAHESSCMPDRPDMFGPTRGDDHRGRSLLPRQRHLR